MYHKHHSEYQNIKWSMIVLSLSLVLVYIVLFYVKWDLWESDLNSSANVNIDSEIKISELNNWNINQEVIKNNEELENNKKLENNENVKNNQDENNNINENTKEDLNDLFVLSWTKTYYGELDFVEKLWISYKYALKDDKNIYYLNMWDYDYDFSDIARKLKWSLYVMNTAQELIANGMFWEKVTYINIPEYAQSRVLILLEVDDQSWLLAIDYAVYHQVKPYLKTLFID